MNILDVSYALANEMDIILYRFYSFNQLQWIMCPQHHSNSDDAMAACGWEFN